MKSSFTAFCSLLAALAFGMSVARAQSPPTELEGRFSDSDQAIELRWHAPDGDPSAYGVYRTLAGGPSFTLVATVGDDRYDDTAISPGSVYDYYVTAFAGALESGPSSIVEVAAGSAPDSTEDPSNVTLQITSAPVTGAALGVPYHYDVAGTTNPAGQSVCFSLHEAPTGMTIDPSTGSIDWLPTAPGMFEVEVRATMCAGGEGEAEQRYLLYVFTGTPGRVDGQVWNDSGTGLPAIRIRLFDASTGDFLFRTTTDDSGRFTFPAVNPATYFVRANDEREIYASQWFDGVVRLADATPVVVGEGSTVTLSFKLRPRSHDVAGPFALSGVVSSAQTGEPLAARVTAFAADDDRRDNDDEAEFDDHGADGEGSDDAADGHSGRPLKAAVAYTDSLGHFTLSLAGGAYILGAAAEGFQEQFWDHKASALEANVVDVHRDTSGFAFALDPRLTGTGSISGTVRLAADSLPLEAHVTAFGRDTLGTPTGIVISTESDSAGQYVLAGLPAGSYIVLAHAHGHDLVPTFYTPSGGTPFLDSAALVSVGATAVSGIDIFVQQDSVDGLDAIEGEVDEEHEQGGKAGLSRSTASLTTVPGAIVVVRNVVTGAVAAADISGPDGIYRLAGVSPGSYALVFQKPGLATAAIPLDLTYSGAIPSTVTVNAELFTAAQGSIASSVSVKPSWNLVSVPVATAEEPVSALFPDATSQAFAYVPGSGYAVSATVQSGIAYWLKFPAPETIFLRGAALVSQSIPVAAGWNMIAALSSPVDAATVQTSSPGLLASVFYSYDGAYQASPALDPGRGYWVKAAASGTLTMSGTAAASAPKSDSPLAALDRMNSITISNGIQSQTLYFGAAAAGVNPGIFALPPPAPGSDAFDARFASGSMVEMHPAGVGAAAAYRIDVHTGTPSLTISWTIHAGTARYTLSHSKGTIALKEGSGTATVAGTSQLVLGATGGGVPERYALDQNYPNPFNPSTTIDYRLPAEAHVTLKLFNILGQEVATLVDATEPAGFRSVRVEASGISSGVYFYRLQAGSFTETKRMLLMK